MDMSNPFALVSEGHRLVEDGALVATAAGAVPPPDLGDRNLLVEGRLESLVASAAALADGLEQTGEDLAYVARLFVASDGSVGAWFERLMTTGRFA